MSTDVPAGKGARGRVRQPLAKAVDPVEGQAAPEQWSAERPPTMWTNSAASAKTAPSALASLADRREPEGDRRRASSRAGRYYPAGRE